MSTKFRVQFYTSAPIDTDAVIRSAAAMAGRFSGKQPTYLAYRHKVQKLSQDSLDEVLKSIPNADDELACEGICQLRIDRDEVDPAVAFTWMYPRKAAFEKFCDLRGFPQNLVTFAFPLSRLTATFSDSLVASCGEFAKDLNANYGRGWCHEHERNRPQMGRGGIRSGLPDAYWLNMFGKPFVESIGIEKLDNLELCDSFGDVRIVRASKTYAGNEDMLMARDELRVSIGSEYFRKEIKEADTKGSSGIFPFLWNAYKTREKFREDLGAAEKTVNIEWRLFDENCPKA